MKVVGFCGPRGTGKDTTAGIVSGILQRESISVQCDYFARPMYEVMSILTGKTVEWLSDQRNKNVVWTEEAAPLPCLAGQSSRKLMQTFGTEFVRNSISTEFWVQHFLKRARDSGCDLVFVTDVRFDNEAVVCDSLIEVRRTGVEYTGEHASERGVPAHLIDATFWLTPEMSYAPIAGFASAVLHR